MARSYIKLKISVWRTDFTDLSIEAEWLYWVLASHPATSSAGVLPLQPRKWAGRASNADTDTVADALQELVDSRRVMIDEDTEEVLIRTFIRHDEGWRNPNMRKGIVSAIERIESARLRMVARNELETAAEKAQREGSEQDHTEDPLQDPDEPPTESHTEDQWQSNCNLQPSTISAEPGATRTPDPLFEALIDACHWDYAEMTEKQRRSTGVARAELARVGATPDDIHARAAAYAQKFKNAALTPHALANNWAALNSRQTSTTVEFGGVTMDKNAMR